MKFGMSNEVQHVNVEAELNVGGIADVLLGITGEHDHSRARVFCNDFVVVVVAAVVDVEVVHHKSSCSRGRGRLILILFQSKEALF